MSLNSVFNRFVKSLGDFLAEYEFERDGRVFRRYSPVGDAVVIDLQTSAHSDTSSRIFYVNVALILAPAWAWTKQERGLPASALPKTVDGYSRQRIYLAGDSFQRWEIRDEETATVTLERLKDRLREEMPNLLRLLDREQLRTLAQEESSLGWTVLPWLLAEEGRTEDLKRILFDERPSSTHTSVLTRGAWHLATVREPQARGDG